MFVNLLHASRTSPARFLRVVQNESAFTKDSTEWQSSSGQNYQDLIPAVEPTQHRENYYFGNHYEKALLSKGAHSVNIGKNVLVLKGDTQDTDSTTPRFKHVLVLSVDNRYDLKLHASDGTAVNPPVDLETADLIHFVWHYHDREEISPVRFFRTRHVDHDRATIEDAGEENGPESPSPAMTRNPSLRHPQGDSETNPPTECVPARFRNPPDRHDVRRFPQLTPRETPRCTETWRGNPPGYSGVAIDRNPFATQFASTLERVVDRMQ